MVKKIVKDYFQISCKDNLENEILLLEKDVIKAGLREKVKNLALDFYLVLCPIRR
jgi:hypothetical protein